MSRSEPTYIGRVVSVTGALVRVIMRSDMPSTLLALEGESYRIGQLGGFFRIPLGYTDLYSVCTQVGADAAPPHAQAVSVTVESDVDDTRGSRWMTLVLFGEAIGRSFQRGVGQYPTAGDEVHFLTRADLAVIHGSATLDENTVSIGTIASAAEIPARLNVAALVSRHGAIVGSTGAGKSNLVTVLVRTLASAYSSTRIVLIDVHGEYASALRDVASVFCIRADNARNERELAVPYWALPFAELLQIVAGDFQPQVEAAIRDRVLEMKRAAASGLAVPIGPEFVTADSPIPFSLRKLWFDLVDIEARTYSKSNVADQDAMSLKTRVAEGDAAELVPPRYPPATSTNTEPFPNRGRSNISRQLELLHSRLRDDRYDFLLDPAGGLMPDVEGKIETDLDSLVASWVGHDKPVTVIDVSRVPSEVLPTVVGTLMRMIYDSLFWAGDLPNGGRAQPLLVVLEEAHRVLSAGDDNPASRVFRMIAKEGRKNGVGLVVVTQRPTELDPGVLSQVGTMVALRTTNGADRAHVASYFPDDLGSLGDLLPALRTGEALFIGEAVPLPSRVRVRHAGQSSSGGDPSLPEAWLQARPDATEYSKALDRWRRSSRT